MQPNENKPLLRDKFHVRHVALGVAAFCVGLGGYITVRDVQAASDATMRGAGVLAHIQTNATGLVIITMGIFLAALVVAFERVGRSIKVKFTLHGCPFDVDMRGTQHQRADLDRLVPLIAMAIDKAGGNTATIPGHRTPAPSGHKSLADIQAVLGENRTIH